MEVYFGLGSNRGDRAAHLEAALGELERAGARELAVSPVVESPALLLPGSPAAWNRPFLNLVARARLPADAAPDDWYHAIKAIEARLGRDPDASRWSPRTIDIDLLLWGRDAFRTEHLVVPHRELLERNFVLTPLAQLAPRLAIPGQGSTTVLEWSARVRPIPLWMGVVNCTPDSFSGSGGAPRRDELVATFREVVAAGAHWVDIGGESTRPGASAVSPEEEWTRVEGPLRDALAELGGARLRPRICIDTRHAEVAERALALGVDGVNDVSGLGEERMQALARESGAEWVAVHSVSVPADPAQRLPADPPAPDALCAWLARRCEEWEAAGIDTGRILFDPGIGFGKDTLQALDLFGAMRRFRAEGFRVLVGHSRKSWYGGGPGVLPPVAERDPETLGATLALTGGGGVDVFRVHDVALHVRAHRSWAHAMDALAAAPPPEHDQPV